MSKIKLMEEVSTNTGISWWDENRTKLNEVVKLFNDWQLEHRFDSWEKEKLVARIDLCRKWGENNTFSEWQFEMLDEMLEFINNYDEENE